MKIVAIIPIKLHSTRLPHKNIRKLGGKPLLCFCLERLLSIDVIDSVYVYCSQESIADMLPQGVTFLQRSEALDSDETNFTQIFDAFYTQVKADIYVYAHATAPFLTRDSIQACIRSVLDEGYDSAFSATRLQDFLWTRDFKPLNFNAHNIPRSQDLEPMYRESSGVYVFRKEVFETLRRRVGNNPKVIEVNPKEAIDINTREDFEMAEMMIQTTQAVGAPRVKLLDCTLRDGGYIVDWEFGDEAMRHIIHKLCEARVDFIECGYVNASCHAPQKSIFANIESIAHFLPRDRGRSKFLAMADVSQFLPEDMTPHSGKSIDGLRIVFYKHQIKEALALCKKSIESGYATFMQPMVTIDYTLREYENLIKELCQYDIACISIVDSFGYMDKRDIRRYFDVIDSMAHKQMMIGFHSHNNMDLAFSCAQDILGYHTDRTLIIDASLEGMGRGAGNLYTELIAQYYNAIMGHTYDIESMLHLISAYIEPIKKHKKWGYSPYFFITALYECHPNFATYLLEIDPSVSVSEFWHFVRLIPKAMKTKCKKPYVEELYQVFKRSITSGGGQLQAPLGEQTTTARVVPLIESTRLDSMMRLGGLDSISHARLSLARVCQRVA